MSGRSPLRGSGHSPKGGAASASPAKPSVPNAGEPNIVCPHCQTGLHIAARSVVDNDQRLTWSLHPKEGDMLQAKTVGGTLEKMDGLLRLCAKEDGGHVRCYVERAYTDDDGSVHFDLAVLPVVTRKRRVSDTHPKDGDVKQAPLVSGAVGEAETPNA